MGTIQAYQWEFSEIERSSVTATNIYVQYAKSLDLEGMTPVWGLYIGQLEYAYNTALICNGFSSANGANNYKCRSCPQAYLEGMQKLIESLHVYNVKLESQTGINKWWQPSRSIRQRWVQFRLKVVVLDSLDGTDAQELLHRRQIDAIKCSGSIPTSSTCKPWCR